MTGALPTQQPKEKSSKDMYRIKSILDKKPPIDVLSADSREAIEVVKTLSDNFTTDQAEAKELDSLYADIINDELKDWLNKLPPKPEDLPLPKKTLKKAKKAVDKVFKDKKKNQHPEVITEIENTELAIKVAEADPQKMFEGVSLSQLKKDLNILQTNPEKYFERRIKELREDISRIDQSHPEFSAANLGVDEYSRIYKSLTGKEAGKPSKKPTPIRKQLLTKSQAEVIERLVKHYRQDKTGVKLQKVLRSRNADGNTVILQLYDTNDFFFPRKFKTLDGSGRVRKSRKPKTGSYTIVLKEKFFKKMYSTYLNMEQCGLEASKLRRLGDPESAFYLSQKCGDRKEIKQSHALRMKEVNAKARDIQKKEKVAWRVAFARASREVRKCKKGESCEL